MPNGQVRYRFSGFVLDVGERRLHAGARDVYLPPKTFETLHFLVARAGHLVTKAELLDAIWPGVAVTENALTRCVKEVRAALDDDVHAPRCIETVPRVGYRFIAPVEVETGGLAATSGPAPGPVGLPGEAGPASGDRGAESAAAAVGAGETSAASPEVVPLAPPGAPPRRWGRHLLAVASVAGLFVLVPIGSYLATPPGQQMGFGPRDFVLVTDLDNQTGEPLFDRSLMTAFTSLLEQSQFVNVFPRAGVASSLQRMGKPRDHAIDEETGREVCQREHVRGLVATSIARVGSRYALTARLIEPQSGRVVRARVEYADGRDQVLGALRKVASALRSDLGESMPAIRTSDRPLEQVTTPSLEALKLYSDGIAAWDKGDHSAALPLYIEAVGKDPGFAKAHAALGLAYCGFVVGDREKCRTHFDKAIELSERTTDRERRSIGATYAHQMGRWGESVELYSAYLQSYPDDFRIRSSLAGVLRQLARFDEAVAQYQQVLRVAPNYVPAHINLATCYGPLGRPADAVRQYERAFELDPARLDTPNINHEYGFALVKAGDAAKARATFERALSSPARASALRSVAMLDMYEGRYGAAIARLGQALASSANPLNEARNRLFLAMALEARGDVVEARRELRLSVDAARRARANPWLFSRIGVAMARAGMVREASGLLGEVRPGSGDASPEQLVDLHRLEGEIAMARGGHAAAIDLLARADGGHRSAFTVESLARAQRLAGHRDEATRLYRTLIGMVTMALGFEPQQGWLEAHYWLALMQAQAGQRDRAAETAGALLALWREADDDLPLLPKLKALAAREE